MSNESNRLSECSIHEEHCFKCVNVNTCKFSAHCSLIQCPNQCGCTLHQCKSSEHLTHICANQKVDCANRANGCKLKVKRSEMSRHLLICAASVIRCSSYRMRKMRNKNEKNNQLKWPDPIKQEHKRLLQLNNNHSNRQLDCSNINDILLEQDYLAVKEFANTNPLKFIRMYGHLIGIKIFKDYSQSKFSFMKHLLINVKSKIFPGLESENCIVFNDELGCSACQSRLKTLESELFRKLRLNFHFDSVLYDVIYYEDFVDQKVYMRRDFLDCYEKYYLNEKAMESQLNTNSQDEAENELTLNQKLVSSNKELVDVIELNKAMKLNVAQELPCEAFQLQYESYRTIEKTFKIDCDCLLRRDEYEEHYKLYHNFVLTNSEEIDLQCPFHEYGCTYFERKYDFLFDNRTEFSYPSANLVKNHLNDNIIFDLSYCEKPNNFEETNERDEFKTTSLLELPFDCLYEIIDKLDSFSLFNLSLTCKALREICEQFLLLRGIVYPKWVRQRIDDNNNNTETHQSMQDMETTTSDLETSTKPVRQRYKWNIQCFAYSYSKHIQHPTCIRLKTQLSNTTTTNNSNRESYNQHVQNCSFRVIKEQTKRFKIYPPFELS